MGVLFIKHWHVIQVLSGQEDKFISRVTNELYVAFTPKKLKWIKRGGNSSKVEQILFKGYVFIETDQSYLDFLNHYNQNIKPVKGFIRLLGLDRKGAETIYPHERAFIEKFTNKEKIVEVSTGFIVGDKVTVTDGPLLGFESLIKKIDRHKRLAYLEFNFFDQKQEVSIGLEVIKKINH